MKGSNFATYTITVNKIDYQEVHVTLRCYLDEELRLTKEIEPLGIGEHFIIEQEYRGKVRDE